MTDRPENPHLHNGVHRLGPPVERARLVVVAAHGRDQSPDFLRDHLVEPLSDRLGPAAHEITWLLPRAAAGSWYPSTFMAATGEDRWVGWSLDVLAAIADTLADRDPRTVVWAGFSQGACLATEHVARHPTRWGGLVALTGGRFGPPDTDLSIAGHLAGTPAYFAVGDRDEWAPLGRVLDTIAAFAAAGAAVTLDVVPGRPHLISPVEIERVAELLLSAIRSGEESCDDGDGR